MRTGHSDDTVSMEKSRPQFGEIITDGGQLVSNSRIVINSTKIPEPTSMLITPKPHPDEKLTGHRAKPKPKPKGREKPPWFSTTPERLARKIELYHKDAERRCLTDYADDLHDPGYYCPCLPTEFRAYNYHNFPFSFC